MAITRMTQNMMMDRSVSSLQIALGRLAKSQEQMSTGRILNRPSDSPTDTTAAMKIRASMADQAQYARNAEDGLGWLNQIDTALSSVLTGVNRAKDLALQGASTGSNGPTAREALATEVDQIRQGALATANTTYLGRPVFGGITAGKVAYGDPVDDATWVGTVGDVKRTVAEGVEIKVNVDGPTAFVSNGNDLFDILDELSVNLRANPADEAAISGSLDKLDAALNTITKTLADVGTKAGRIEKAVQTAKDNSLNLQTSLSNIENVDLPKGAMELQMQQIAYQAALATTAKVMQPSLMDFLR